MVGLFGRQEGAMGSGAESEEGSAMRRGGFLGWFGANCASSFAKVGGSRGCGVVFTPVLIMRCYRGAAYV